MDSLCPLLHLFMRVKSTCLACFSVAKDDLAPVSCHHDTSFPSRMRVSASVRMPSILHSIPITAVMGSIGLGTSQVMSPSISPSAVRVSGSVSISIPSMSKCACLICPFGSTVSLLLLLLTISDSVIFSESDEYGASSAPFPHRPVSIPSLSHSACPRRKLSGSALIV